MKLTEQATLRPRKMEIKWRFSSSKVVAGLYSKSSASILNDAFTNSSWYQLRMSVKMFWEKPAKKLTEHVTNRVADFYENFHCS